MINKLQQFKYPLFTLLLALVVLIYFYHLVLLHPNEFLFSANGDGIKNYYTYLFHARYDSGFANFTGMNYPFNEHIVYTDAHPLLSYLIGQFDLVDYGIGIVNLCMLLSYPVAAVFIQRILNHYGLTHWWSIIGAVVIAFLSPQVFRLTGHYSMSYVFAIPLMWWLLIQCNKRNPWLWSIITAIYLTCFFFTHPYLGIIMAFLSAFYAVVYMVIHRGQVWKRIMLMSIQIFVPFALFQGYILLTDTHLNRLSNPAGFFHYYANWKALLVAHDGPLKTIYRSLDVRIGDWETWAYLGFYTIVFAAVILIDTYKRRKEIVWKQLIKKEATIFFIAAYLILLFSFCFPLKYDWLRWIADLFGPLKQFRILGRFTWVFYYVSTVLVLVGFYRIYTRKKELYYSILFYALMVFAVFEFYGVHYHTARAISSGKNKFQLTHVSTELKEVISFVEAEKYDAFIFLPFNHMSSENLMILGTEEANHDAFLVSYHSGLPMVNSVSSRMSITETILVNNFFSREFVEKEFAEVLPKDAKIAIIKRNSYIKPDEMRLIWNSKKQFQNEEYAVLDYNKENWNSPKYFREIAAAEKEAIHPIGGGWSADTAVFIIYENFDDEKEIEWAIWYRKCFFGQ
jgi:hypothetical protein